MGDGITIVNYAGDSESRIVVPAGPRDALAFVPDEIRRSSSDSWADAWLTRWPYSPKWTLEYYTVCPHDHPHDTAYDAHRPPHPLLGEFSGRFKNRKKAMQACADDFEKVARLQRWVEYMATHEPGEPPAHRFELRDGDREIAVQTDRPLSDQQIARVKAQFENMIAAPEQ